MSRSQRVVISIALGLLLLSVPRWVAVHPVHADLDRIEADVERLLGENLQLRSENALILEQLDAIGTDRRLVEQRARGELNYVRSDEVLFVFAESGHDAQP